MGLRLQSSTMAHARTLALACACALTGAVAVPAAQGAEGGVCPNEALRLEQGTTFLPDCRAYERVSPEDKGGGDVVGDGDTTVAATNGGAVAFNSRTAFGDEVGTGADGQSTYVARRGASGWTGHGVTPTGKPEAIQTLFLMTNFEAFSDDLTHGVVWGYDLPNGGGTPDRANIYEEDLQSHALQAMTLSPSPWFAGELLPTNIKDWGVSADAQHAAFGVSSVQMLPDAAPEAGNVYQWDAGKGLSVAGILPHQTVAPPGGSHTEWGGGALGGYRGAMSADGSRLLFMATPPGSSEPQLYMRIDGERTAWISESENTSETVEPAGIQLQYMTPSGNTVFFATSAKLLSEDTNNGPDLYRWTYGPDPEHEKNLTLITSSGSFTTSFAGQPMGIIGTSDDGTRVYYQINDAHLVVWDNGTSKVISAEQNPDAGTSTAAMASDPGNGRVSPDGKWLAFVSHTTFRVDGVHGIAPDLAGNSEPVTNSHYEMYVYSLAEDRLVCVSCPPVPATSNAMVTPDVTEGSPALMDTAVRPRFLTSNGRVFFSTREALVPQDTNGVEDVYEYDGETGKLSLLSTGAGSEPSSFGDASANGEDVFVLTRQQLLGEDHDPLVDLYDVRTGGGFPAPPSGAGCVADECQPQPAQPPGFIMPASVGFAGAGNLPASASKPVAKPQSNKHRLARALRACKQKHGRARHRCEARARARYGKNVKSSRGSK